MRNYAGRILIRVPPKLHRELARELVVDLPDLRVCSDPDDDKFLATAVSGKADYLVTGDRSDLHSLRGYKNVAIVSPRRFSLILNP